MREKQKSYVNLIAGEMYQNVPFPPAKKQGPDGDSVPFEFSKPNSRPVKFVKLPFPPRSKFRRRETSSVPSGSVFPLKALVVMILHMTA